MLPRSIIRRVGGSSRAARPASLARFQASMPAQTAAAAPAARRAGSDPTPHEAATKPAVQPAGAPAPPRRYNRKLREIVSQVGNSVSAVTDVAGAELAEAVDVFEEAAAYLREIQGAENIPDDALYSIFQPVSARLLDLALRENANLGSRSVEAVLDMYVENRVAHAYHFVAVQQHYLARGREHAYAQALQVWISFLEYSKQMATAGAGRLVRGGFGVYRERGFQASDALNLAYFALISHCVSTGETYDLATTVKILQVDDASRVPPSHHVVSTLGRWGLREAVPEAVRAFTKRVAASDIANMDPNGAGVDRKIEQLGRAKNANGLRRLFADMKAASVQNGIAICEPALNRVMSGFIEAGSFADALAIFASISGGLIARPSPASWELALKALGHPTNVGRMSDLEKKQALEHVEATFRTMVASGVPVSAKVLGVFVGSLANLDRQDLVAQYLAQYQHVPVVHMTKNNILVGLALNGKLAAAETQMREFLAADGAYVPSTSVMNTFLAHYVAEGNDKAVEGILDFMHQKGIEENIATATTVLNYYFKTYRAKGLVPNTTEVLAEVIKDVSRWDQFMVATLIDGLVKDGVNIDAARGVFRYFCDVKRRFKHSSGMLTSMIKAEMEFGSVHNAEDLFEWYVKNVRNEPVMYNMMIKGLLLKRESLALKYYADLCEQRPFNVAPNFYTYYFLLDHFTKKNDRTKVQWVLDEIAAAQLADYGRDLPRIIRRLAGDYQVSPEFLAALPGPQ